MSKRFAYVTALVLTTGLVAIPVAEAARSKVVLNYWTGAAWVGHVVSSKKSCENGRKVTVYRKIAGRDEKIGSDKSAPGKGDSEGVFLVTDPAAVEGSTYYAKVGNDGPCDGDKSKDFDYPEDQPY